MATIAELAVSINADMAGLKQGQAETKAILDKIAAGFDDLGKKSKKSTDDIGTQFQKMAQQLIGVSSILKVFKEGLNFNKEMETAKVAFGVMIGSTTKANSLIKELQETAKKTPMAFGELQAAAKNLLAFGIGAEDINKNLIMIGDIASGIGAPVEDLAAIFGKIKTSGKVMADDLNQLGGRGIPAIAELAKVLGVAEGEVRKMVEKGKVGFPEIEKAFQNMTGEGGKFQGMMEKQSTTFGGMLSTMQDTLTQFAGKMTESLITPMKIGMTLIDGLNNAFGMLPSPIQTVIASFAMLSLAVGGLILGAQMLGIALPAAFGPWGIAIAGAVALILGVIEAFKQMEAQSKKTAEVMATDFAKGGKSSKELEDSLKTINEVIAKNDRDMEAAQKSRTYDKERIALIKEERAELERKKQAIVSAMQSAAYTEKTKKEIEVKTVSTGDAADKKRLEDEEKARAKAQADWLAEQDVRIAMEANQKAYDDRIQAEENGNKIIANDRAKAMKILSDMEAEKSADDLAYIQAKIDAQKEADANALEGMRKTNEVVNNVFNILNSTSENIGTTILTSIGGALMACIPLAAGLSVTIGAIEAPLTAIIAVTAVIVTAISSVVDMIQSAEKRAQEMAQKSMEINSQIIDNKMAAERRLIDMQLKSIEKERVARLKAAGIIVKTDKDVQNEKMKNLEEQLQAAVDATDLESAARIRAAIEEQKINDEFDRKKEEAQEASDARMRKYQFDKAVAEKAMAHATAQINLQKALSELPWAWQGNERRALWEMYTALGQSIDAIPLPQLANGTNWAMGGATLVGERGAEIINVPRGASVTPAHDAKGKSASGGNTFVFNSPMQLNPSQAAEAMRSSMRQLAFQCAF